MEQHYPELKGNIAGAQYPPPPFAERLLFIAQTIQISAVALLLGAGPITRALGFTEIPPLVTKMRENQMQIFIGLFVMSSFVQNLKNTGAFEVQLNGKVIFSKLESGRMPNMKELINLLEISGIETPITVRALMANEPI